jgi:site-specific recombinase XerD
MKLKELYQPFLDDCNQLGLKGMTIYTHKNLIYKVLIPALGDIKLNELLPVHASLVINEASSYGRSVPRAAVITLRRVLRYAKKCRYPFSFDIEELELPEYKRSKDPKALTMEKINEIRTYLKTPGCISNKHASRHTLECHEYSKLRTLCLFELLLHTGLRISEALRLNVSDIDFNTNELRIENCKDDGSWDSVYLYGAQEAIDRYLRLREDENPALFVTCEGERLTLNGAKSYIRHLKDKFNVDINHKIWRSTFITTLLRGGVDIKQTQLLARHKSMHTTADYYYAVEKEKLKPIHAGVMTFI